MNAHKCNFCELSPAGCLEIIGREPDEEYMILDVRTAEEFENGHIAGAYNLDYFGEDFPSRLKALDRDRLYIVYCQKGIRGLRAMDMMKSLGFRRVVNIKGGFENWKSSVEV